MDVCVADMWKNDNKNRIIEILSIELLHFTILNIRKWNTIIVTENPELERIDKIDHNLFAIK